MSRSRFASLLSLCLVLITLVLVATPAFALGPRAIRVMLGGSWMGQSFNYTGADLFNPDRKFWMTGGASVEIGLLGRSPLDLEVGVMYIQKGMKTEIKETDPEGTVTGTITLDPNARYLSFPILLRYRFGEGTISPYLVAGPTLEVKLSSDGQKVFDQVYDRMDTANVGIQAGVGVELGNIGASVRYVRDLNTPYDKLSATTLDSVVNDGVLALVTLRLWGR
jgi:Outer membrane protein beta-barrel domain